MEDHDYQYNFINQYRQANNLQYVTYCSCVILPKSDIQQSGIYQIINTSHKGDILIISELFRLGRSTVEILEIVSLLLKKCVNIHIIKGNLILSSEQSIIDISSFASEIESGLKSQRIKESLYIKRMNGHRLGRPKDSRSSRLDSRFDKIKELCQQKIPVSSIARAFCVPQPTMYYFCKTRGLI